MLMLVQVEGAHGSSFQKEVEFFLTFTPFFVYVEKTKRYMYAYYRSGIELIKCSSDCLQLKNCKKKCKNCCLVRCRVHHGSTFVEEYIYEASYVRMYVCMYIIHVCTMYTQLYTSTYSSTNVLLHYYHIERRHDKHSSTCTN